MYFMFKYWKVRGNTENVTDGEQAADVAYIYAAATGMDSGVGPKTKQFI